jgi:hypothetical protein
MADPADETIEWPTGLKGIETWQLVDELLKRGWTARNYKKRVMLLAPVDHTPQGTRK